MTDTTTLSGPLLDYYTALAENMPNPRLVKHQRGDEFICVIKSFFNERVFNNDESYSPTTNPALALPIIEMLVCNGFNISSMRDREGCEISVSRLSGWPSHISVESTDLTEAALRALVAWKFPDGLPEPVYEKEES